MGEDAGPTLPPVAGDNDAIRPSMARDQVTGPQHGSHQAAPTRPLAGVAPPTRPPGDVAPPTRPPGGVAPPTRPLADGTAPADGTAGEIAAGIDPGSIVRYGPGVPTVPPAIREALTAETIWRTGRLPESSHRPVRIRRLLSTALTVVLLAASAVIFYLRFHHAPFNVTGVTISRQKHTVCEVIVTGQIVTDGAAGTISYRWLYPPGQTPSQSLSQSVISGQKAVYVSIAIRGQGQGTASQTVILQVLGPDAKSASAGVTVSC